MTVTELITYLQTLPGETRVEVVTIVRGTYEGDYGKWVELNQEDHLDFTDMTGNQFAVGQPYQDDKTLCIGEV